MTDIYVSKGFGKMKDKVRRFFNLKNKTWRHDKVIALVIVAVLIAQMLVGIPGISFAAGNRPDKDDLWMYPEIEYMGRRLYDGMVISADAELNAKYEFIQPGDAFPLEVLLPDGLYAPADEYKAVAFDIHGVMIPGAKVIVDKDGVIKVHFDAPDRTDDTSDDTYAATGEGGLNASDDCCESCDDNTGSSDRDDANSGSSTGIDSDDFDVETAGNDENTGENPDSETGSDASSGSDEPVNNYAETGSESEYGSSGSSGETSAGSGSESGAGTGTETTETPGNEAGDEDGMNTKSQHESITISASEPPVKSMFDNIGTSTANATYTGLIEEFRIVFELPCFLDPDELPEMPEPVFNEETEEWDDPELWLIEIFNTILRPDGEYKGEFVTIELLNEFDGFELMPMMEIMALDADDIQADTERFFVGSINWNDGNNTGERRTPFLPPGDFELTLHVSVPAFGIDRPITAQDLIDWGWVKPADGSPEALAAAITAAENLITTPTPAVTGPGAPTTGNLWSYTYTGLPANLTVNGTSHTINYWFTMNDETAVGNAYLIEDLRPGTVGYRNTAKETFTIVKEWKDNHNAYGTRPNWGGFIANLNFGRSFGATDNDPLGTVTAPDRAKIPHANVGPQVTINPDTWRLTITNIPAFAPDGVPYHYFVRETPIPVPLPNPWTSSTVRYEPTYVNDDNYAGDVSRVFGGGHLVNRLTDIVPFVATKEWQDDGAAANRPDGIFQLYRYAETPGMSWQTASPVSGMEIPIGKTSPFDIGAAFMALPARTTLFPDGFPRFDSEGAEYVYFLKERTFPNPSNPLSGEYKSFPDYTGVRLPDSVLPGHTIINDILFNGGTLNNRRDTTADLSVTKTWEATATQSMNADVEVMITRKLAGNPAVGRPEGPPVAVPAKDLGGTVDGVFTLSGFRAEIMSITEALSLPKYNDEGILYIYEIKERAVVFDRTATSDGTRADVRPDGTVRTADGYTYKINTTTTGGNTELSNTLVGEAEIRIRKIWNGVTAPNGVPVTFEVSAPGIGVINPNDPRISSITIDNATTTTVGSTVTTVTNSSKPYTTPLTERFTIGPDDAWYRPTAGAADGDTGDWLVIKGLPRYDAQGREIEYSVREVPIPAGYHNTFGFRHYDRVETVLTETVRTGVTETTFINTPSTQGGRYMRVSKEWDDDGDLNCRANVVMQLFYIGPARNLSVPLGTVTLTRDMDWTGHIALSHRVDVSIPDPESPGGFRTESRIDNNHNNYMVREISVGAVSSGFGTVEYGSTVFPFADTALTGTTRLGTVRTSAHRYDVFARFANTRFTGAAGENRNHGHDGWVVGGTADGNYEVGVDYRTHYTFRNVRQGDVEIDLTKIWNDDNLRLHVPQRVEIHIERRLNHESTFRALDYDGLGHTPVAGGFTGVVYLQHGTSLGLTWNSVARLGNILPKYNADGVLYVYRITEAYVNVMSAHSDTATVVARIPVGSTYTLPGDEKQTYSVSYSPTYTWGDHLPGGATATLRDIYKYDITNQRSETILFEVYKLWHDVGRNQGPAGSFDPRIENHVRPDIFLNLYQSYKTRTGPGPEDYTLSAPVPSAYVKRFWSTSGEFNDHFWKCTFDPLQRYDSQGREIVYFVREEMPNRAGSEYVTEYYDSLLPPVPVGASGDLDGVARNRITNIEVHDIPAGTTDPLYPERIQNGGIIINRREFLRELSGSKVWKNVPSSNTLPIGFPDIYLALMERLDHRDDNAWERAHVLTAGDINTAELKGGRTEFQFVTIPPGGKLHKYNNFGVYILYRAEEVKDALGTPLLPGEQPRGYLSPVYNDYIMEVINEYNIGPKAPTVTVSVNKTWNVEPFSHTLPVHLRPTATFELWRVMTTNGSAAGAIPGTEVKVAQMDVPYSATPQTHTFNSTHFITGTNGIPTAEGLKLLRIGYNAMDYHYYVTEKMDGYTMAITRAATDLIPPPLTGNITFNYNAINTFNGSSDPTVTAFIRVRGDKLWNDDLNKFNTRPTTGDPIVNLKVFRAIQGNITNTLEDITDCVTITWTPVAPGDNTASWSYVITANATATQRVPVGLPPTSGLIEGGRTLYRYSPTGQPYIYYIEEVAPVGNQHYTIHQGGSGTDAASVTSAIPVSPNSLRLQAASSGNDRIASFENRLETVKPTIEKTWMKYGASGASVAMSASNPAEFELMLPVSLTFKVQYRDGTTGNWTNFSDRHGTAMVMTVTRAQLLALKGTNNQMTVEFDISLPRYNPAGTAIRNYRLVETHVGADAVSAPGPNDNYPTAPISAGTASGFDVTYTSNTGVTNTIQTIPLLIRKIWDDDSNRDNLRPTSMTLKFTRACGRAAPACDQSRYVTYTLSTTGNVNVHEGTYYLPKHCVNGTDLCSYTVEELYGNATARGYYTMTSDENPTVPAVVTPPTKTFILGPSTTNPGEYEFINTHDKIRFNITATKTWSDDGIGNTVGTVNVDSIRPTHVHLTLMRSTSGVPTQPIPEFGTLGAVDPLDAGIPATRIVNASDGWPAVTWNSLIARHDVGVRYHFSIKETECTCVPKVETLKAYTPTYTYTRTGSTTHDFFIWDSNTSGAVTATVQNTLDVVSLTTTKLWQKADGTPLGVNEFSPPQNIQVQLLYRLTTAAADAWTPATGTANTVSLHAGTTGTGANWTHTWSNLPKENNAGIAYVYTVREVNIGGVPITTANEDNPLFSFERNVTRTGAGGGNQTATVTNKLQTYENAVTVTKVWNDNNNQDGVRPAPIQVVLIRDMGVTGEEMVSAPITLHGGTTEPGANWTAKWENLPRYRQNGIDQSTYHVREILPATMPASNAYTLEYSINGGAYSEGVEGTGAATGHRVIRVFPGTGTSDVAVNVRNSYTPKTMRVTATKAWNDTNYSFARPVSITLQLYVTTDPLAAETSLTAYGAPVTVTSTRSPESSTPWTHTWSGLPIKRNTNTTGPEFLNSTSVQLYYVVREINPVGYTPVITYTRATGSTGEATADRVNGVVQDATNLEHNATITNSLDKLTSLRVRKAWRDSSGGNILTPGVNPLAKTADVVVQLQYRLIPVQDSEDWADAPGGDLLTRRTLTSTNLWTETFPNLPIRSGDGRAFEYRVREVSIGSVTIPTTGDARPYSYTYSSTGVNASAATPGDIALTNTLIERGNIIVVKDWNDENNRDGIRPAAITVRLTMDQELGVGSRFIEKELNQSNGWRVTFENLPRYRPDGTPSTYHVQEMTDLTGIGYELPQYQVLGADGDASYTSTTTSSNVPDDTAVRTVNVRNTYMPKTMNIKATKEWEDDDDFYGARPASITLELWAENADGTGRGLVESKTISSTDASDPTAPWEVAEWNNLPIRRNTGSPSFPNSASQLLRYTVIEVAVNSYESEYEYNGNSDDDYISGSLLSPGSVYNAVVTNTLETVEIEVIKEWEDQGDLYEMRPSDVTFTLQRRTSGAFVDVTDRAGNVITKDIDDTDTGDSQTVKFEGLPKFNSAGDPWVYRVIETAADGVAVTGHPDFPGNPERGIIGDPNRTHYEITASTSDPDADGNFATTVINELIVETISISGIKFWEDDSDSFGARPDELELQVWYLYNDAQWRFLNPQLYDINIVWDKPEGSDEWTYTVTGDGLIKYVPNVTPLKLQEYMVVEIEPESGLYKGFVAGLYAGATGTGVPEAHTDQELNTVGKREVEADGVTKTGNIIEANFINMSPYDVTSLWVHKQTDCRDYDAIFEFEVYFSNSAVSEGNPGTRYRHHYDVYDGTQAEFIALYGPYELLTELQKHDLEVSGVLVRKLIPSSGEKRGIIEIGKGQSFILDPIPQGINFSVRELEHADYIISPEGRNGATAMNGRTGVMPENAAATDPPPAQASVRVFNELQRDVQIVNDTPNEGRINSGGRLTNAGGKVSVELFGGQEPGHWGEDDIIPDALAVLWEPDVDRFWVLGDFFIIEYWEFGDDLDEDAPHRLEVRNYVNEDGSLRRLEDCDVDNLDILAEIIGLGARLEMREDGVVRLVLAHDIEDMPRRVLITVQFLPTLAVRNVTENESNGGSVGNIGGQVMVECTSTGGSMNGDADGVPDLGGTPYKRAISVYGVPDPGYKIDWDYIVIRNLNDLDDRPGGSEFGSVQVFPDENGYFTAELRTTIAGRDEVVIKTGRVTEGSIRVTMDDLPVPLQIDLRFIPDDSVLSGTTGGSGTGRTQGDGLPRTGVESVIVMLVLGFVTSLVATAAVIAVIRRQNLKDKKV